MQIRASLQKFARDVATRLLPESTRRRIRGLQRKHRLQSVPVGTVDFGGLRRLTPISPVFGLDRDLLTIERYYIEKFLGAHAADIRGRVLEFGDPGYTRKFGGERVVRSDVLSYVEGNPQATLVADLTTAKNIEDDSFDCIIITQTLQMIYDVRAAVCNLCRILAPGGVVLATSHGISRVARREGVDSWGEYWHFTSQSQKRLFAEFFPPGNVEVSTWGNVLAAVGTLHGLAAADLRQEEIDRHDPNYEVMITVRARKDPA